METFSKGRFEFVKTWIIGGDKRARVGVMSGLEGGRPHGLGAEEHGNLLRDKGGIFNLTCFTFYVTVIDVATVYFGRDENYKIGRKGMAKAIKDYC